jgi:hypothetical protein
VAVACGEAVMLEDVSNAVLSGKPENLIPYADWVVLALGLSFTLWLSVKVFDQSFKLADVPTFPKYMTRWGQYHLGQILFALGCALFYALLIHYHTDIATLAAVVQPETAEKIKTLTDQKNPSYLIIIAIVSAFYFSLFYVESKWNIIILFRDLVYSWIAIPRQVKKIMDLSIDELLVPITGREAVSASSNLTVHESDFEKNEISLDRQWAELCYVNWWLQCENTNRRDTTFFSEEQFAWRDSARRFEELRTIVSAYKTAPANQGVSLLDLMTSISKQRHDLGRIVACYLVYMNSSRVALALKANQFGVDLEGKPSKNPIYFLAAYIACVLISVYIGAYFSAIIFDLFNGISILDSINSQNLSDVQRWSALAFGNYGVPIIVILVIRSFIWRVNPIREYSISTAYSWILLLSALASTFGLSVAIEIFARESPDWSKLLTICEKELRWAIGPAFICVYINHYMDRQIDPSLPDIGSDGATAFRRVLIAVAFTIFIVLITLPSLTTIITTPTSVWVVSKLRFVALGTIITITLMLTMVAQFAFTKRQVAAQDGLPAQLAPG